MQVRVERMAYGPEAIARKDDGKTVFVSGAVAGDLAEVELTEEGARFDRARVLEIVEPSPQRVSPRCPWASVCGGCPWAGLSDEGQLESKRSIVVDSLTRVGHLERGEAEVLVAPIERQGEPWGYRNKVELATDTRNGRLVLGMHGLGDAGIVKIDQCPLFDKRQAKLIRSISGALSYLSNAHSIRLERVGIRSSARTRDVELALWTEPGPFPRAQVAKVLKDAAKTSSLVRVLTKGPKKARRVMKVERLSGKGYWTERIAGGRMALSAPSFFQVNTPGAERLVELALEMLSPTKDDEAMDLYCGAGTFTMPLARAAGYVSAVESSGPAVRDLRRNLERSGIENVEDIGGDAGREFPEVPADIVIVDPPRAGLAESVVRLLSEQPARAIAYVSCDPATLARDIARFAQLGNFKPARIVPVDLFPQTYHVENVCLLTRR